MDTVAVRPLLPETRRQLEELYRCRDRSVWKWLMGPRAVDLLQSVAGSGEVAAVPELVPLLLGGGAIAEVAARAMARLLDGQPMKEISHLEALRAFGGCEHCKFGEWSVVRSEDVVRLGGVAEAWAPLGVLSFHPNGWIREAAVHELAKLGGGRGHEIPFLLLRMNDWVPEVRAPAVKAMWARLQPEAVDGLVRALPLIVGLQEPSRRVSHPDFIAAAMVLIKRAGRDALFEGTTDRRRDLSRACFRVLFDDEEGGEALISAALASADPVIRVLAARRLRATPTTPGSLEMLVRAARDPVYAVRREAIGLLVDHFPDRATPFLEAALTDSHPVLRSIARIELARVRSGFVAAEHYRAQLATARGRRLRSAIAGLAECRREEDVLDLLPLLVAASPKVKRAALLAIASLDTQSVEPFLDTLEDANERVAMLAAEVLSRRTGPRVLEAALSMGERSDASSPQLRAAFQVISSAAPWTRIGCLLRAASSDNAAWAGLAAGGLDARAPSPPLPDERAAIEAWLPRAKIAPTLAASIEAELAMWAARKR